MEGEAGGAWAWRPWVHTGEKAVVCCRVWPPLPTSAQEWVLQTGTGVRRHLESIFTLLCSVLK